MLRLLNKAKKNKQAILKVALYFLLITAISLLAWGKVLSFWFFKGFEAGWLMGVPHTVAGLFRAHAFINFLNYKFYGWNPSGWYLTALVLHTIASYLVFTYVYIITKKPLIAVISSLFFVASIVYHDVITWGSFNSYYGLMMILVLSSLIFYHYFRQTRRYKYYMLSLLFAFFAFLNRESGLTLLAIISLYELIIKAKTGRKNIRQVLVNLIPFFVTAGVYFLIRHRLGGVAGDYSDDSVQLRIRLLKDHLYIPLFARILVAFGRHFASLWFPYVWLNALRQKIYIYFSVPEVKLYFFTLVGWLSLLASSIVVFFQRKSYLKKYLLFGLTWAIVWTAVVAVAIPSSDTVLSQDYFWNTRRYNYYAFFGIALFWAVLFFQGYEYSRTKFKNKKTLPNLLLLVFVGSVVVGNIVWLRQIEDGLLLSVHKQSRKFYNDFKNYFPSLSPNYGLYQYPHTDGLNDYLYEWSFLKDTLYPSLKGVPFRTENQLARILEKISTGKLQLDDVIFLDYDADVGLINKTQNARQAITNQKIIQRYSSNIVEISEGALPVEIPYKVEVSAIARPAVSANRIEDSRLKEEMRKFVRDHFDFIKSSSATVSATMSQRLGEPFLHLLPENLIDGNFGQRSGWIADSIPAVITIDLGKEKTIRSIWWTSQEGPRVPSSYIVESSLDGETWAKIKDVKLNSATSRIDLFDEPVLSRFVRMTIETTNTGTFAYLDEIGIVGEGASGILDYYKDPRKMVTDSTQIDGLTVGWVKLTWTTNKTFPGTTPQEVHFPILTDGNSRVYTLRVPEMEIFSRQGEFLNKFITSLEFTPAGAFELSVNYVKLIPLYGAENPR